MVSDVDNTAYGEAKVEGLVLNSQKCTIKQKSISFFGSHKQDNVRTPAKGRSATISWIITYLSRYIPNFAEPVHSVISCTPRERSWSCQTSLADYLASPADKSDVPLDIHVDDIQIDTVNFGQEKQDVIGKETTTLTYPLLGYKWYIQGAWHDQRITKRYQGILEFIIEMNLGCQTT